MESGVLTPSATRAYWGPWATLGFYVLFLVVMAVAGFVGLLGFALMTIASDPLQPGAQVRNSGLLWALWVAAVCQFAVACGLILLRRGESVVGYLALKRITVSTLLRWLGLTMMLIVVSDLTQVALNRPIVPSVMTEQYRNAGNLPLLWSVVIVAAPLWEEIIFRGFLMAGFLNSRLGTVGAILLTTALWAVLHTQYDIYGIASVSVTGLLLGYARVRTGSTITTVAMHAFGNVIAMVETAAFVRWGN